eukprot:7485933-Pyramimonas_sp.AAC.1
MAAISSIQPSDCNLAVTSQLQADAIRVESPANLVFIQSGQSSRISIQILLQLILRHPPPPPPCGTFPK